MTIHHFARSLCHAFGNVLCGHGSSVLFLPRVRYDGYQLGAGGCLRAVASETGLRGDMHYLGDVYKVLLSEFVVRDDTGKRYVVREFQKRQDIHSDGGNMNSMVLLNEMVAYPEGDVPSPPYFRTCESYPAGFQVISAKGEDGAPLLRLFDSRDGKYIDVVEDSQTPNEEC